VSHDEEKPLDWRYWAGIAAIAAFFVMLKGCGII